MEENKSKIREFISPFLRPHNLSDDEDIFALGFVNSLFAMQLVAFVEQTFGITIEDSDLDLNNFRSITALDNLVRRKTQNG